MSETEPTIQYVTVGAPELSEVFNILIPLWRQHHIEMVIAEEGNVMPAEFYHCGDISDCPSASCGDIREKLTAFFATHVPMDPTEFLARLLAMYPASEHLE